MDDREDDITETVVARLGLADDLARRARASVGVPARGPAGSPLGGGGDGSEISSFPAFVGD